MTLNKYIERLQMLQRAGAGELPVMRRSYETGFAVEAFPPDIVYAAPVKTDNGVEIDFTTTNTGAKGVQTVVNV